MKRKNTLKSIALLTGFAFLLAGCASTIPSRVQSAVAYQAKPIYPVRVAFSTLVDERPLAERENTKKRTWENWRGKVDYFGKSTGEGLTKAIAEYLTATHLFAEVSPVEIIVNESALKDQGYDLVLRGSIEQYTASYSVPLIILAIAVMPNPLFFILPGITLVPAVVWPKELSFDVIIDDLKLYDLRTGQELWHGKIESHELFRKMTPHIAPKWYLGELVEKVSKQLSEKLWEANLRI